MWGVELPLTHKQDQRVLGDYCRVFTVRANATRAKTLPGAVKQQPEKGFSCMWI